jgi:two-component system, NarL family, response regulator YdfI
MIKVEIIASGNISQAGLEGVLRSANDCEVVSSVFDLSDSIQLVGVFEVDVILLEGINYSPATLQQLLDIAAGESGPSIVVLTHSADRSFLWQLFAIGIRGVLPYVASAVEVIAAIRAVAEGLVVFHADFQQNLFEDSGTFRLDFEEKMTEPLTVREREVLALLSQGISNKAIAAQLHLSEHTVKFHLSAIFEKLRVSNRTEAVAIGIRQGLIML